MAMLVSAWLLFRGIFRRSWPILLFVLLDASDMYELYIRQHLPAGWPQTLSLPDPYTFVVLLLVVGWATVMTYHELRTG